MVNSNLSYFLETFLELIYFFPLDITNSNLKYSGGTIHLTTFHKDVHKLSRVLELIIFGLLSLKLENHLLRDIGSSRPTIPEEEEGVELDISQPERIERTASPVEEDDDEESPGVEELIPSEEWFPSLGHKSKWSKSNIWNLIVGSSTSTASSSPTSSPSSPVESNCPLGRSRGASISTIKSGVSMASTTTSTKQHASSTSATSSKNVKARIKSITTNIKSVANRKPSSKNRRVGSSSSTGTNSNIGGHRRGPSMSISVPGVEEEIENGWDFIGGLGKIRAEKKKKAKEKKREKEEVSIASQSIEKEVEKPVEVEEEPTDRFQKVIKAMEKCILSTSPSVVFPPPHLLVRLRQQEISIISSLPPPLPIKSTPTTQVPPIDRLKSYTTTLDAQALAIGFASGKDSIGIPATNGSEVESNFHNDAVSSTSSRATRIGLDAKAGLASLLTNNNSLGGTIRHQGIQFLVETVLNHAAPDTLACRVPQSQSFSYYQNDQLSTDSTSNATRDLTIGQTIERFVEDRDLLCDAVGCTKLRHDHTTYYMHSKERIGISLSFLVNDPNSPSVVEESYDSVRPRISTWTTCQICHTMTDPHLLSTASLCFSFAKYAELLLYDPDVLPYPDLCEHAMKDRGALLRNFAIGKTVVTLKMDKIE